MPEIIAPVKNFVKRNKNAIAVSTVATVIIVPMTVLAVLGMQYCSATVDFINDHDMQDEFKDHLSKY